MPTFVTDTVAGSLQFVQVLKSCQNNLFASLFDFAGKKDFV